MAVESVLLVMGLLGPSGYAATAHKGLIDPVGGRDVSQTPFGGITTTIIGAPL